MFSPNALLLAASYAALFFTLRAARRIVPRSVFALLAVAPWIALLAVVATRGLWWTQRPVGLRLLVEALAIHWTIWCCWPGGRSTATRPLWLVAAGLAVLGVSGSAAGLNPFGCGVSVALMAVAALVLAIAAYGSHGARLGCLTAVAATAIALTAGEAAVRLMKVGDRVQDLDSREYARQFYTLTPPRSAFVNQPKLLDEFAPALVEINSLGIRGPELAEPRADVLIIGDSFVEARQLPWEQTIGPRLQDALRVRQIPRRVVSHGMRGWSPLLEWNWYLKAGRQLQAKDVFVVFFWNDLWTSGTEAATFRAALTADGRPASFDVPVDLGVIWYKHTRLVRLTEAVWQRASLAGLKRAFSGVGAGTLSSASLGDDAARTLALTMADGPPLSPAEITALLTQPAGALSPELRRLAETAFWPAMRDRAVWSPAQQQAADAIGIELQRFAEDVAAGGGRLHIVYVPNPYQVHPRECSIGRLVERLTADTLLPPDSGIQSWLREAAGAAGISLLDPTEPMRRFDQAQPPGAFVPLYLRADCHWSPRGQQFIADSLGDFLATR